MLLPAEAQPLLAVLLPHLSRPTYTRLVVLTAAAVVTTGRRTVANLLRTVGDLAPGDAASYRRVLSAAEWSGLALGCALARFLLEHLVPDGPVHLVGDDTVDGHPGPRVYGKGRHRDAVRSSHSFTAWRYGHQWVVRAVLVQFPFAARRWALPVLVDLYRTPEVSRAEGVRHRTPAQLMCRLLRVLLIRFPDRTFVFAGDARGRPVLPPPPPAAHFGEQVPPGRQPVRAGPALHWRRPAAGEGGAGAEAPSGRGRRRPHPADGGVVRGRDAAGGGGDRGRPVVQERGGRRPRPVGVRQRSHRHPPGRVPVHHRPGVSSGRRRRHLLWSVEHRDLPSRLHLKEGVGLRPSDRLPST